MSYFSKEMKGSVKWGEEHYKNLNEVMKVLVKKEV